ncbi:PilN domain-containing protein [Hathewaya histolytica]|uniref:PilN domain-containing protein n=1 Tax=Hathewaya histolytica TaxID=1498 RepID=UPI003B683FD2
MRDINFLKNNSILKQNNSSERTAKLLGTSLKVVVVLVILGYAAVFAINYVLGLRTDMVKTDMAQYSEVIELNEKIKTYTRRMSDISSIVEKSEKNIVMNSDRLKSIGEIMPDNVSLLNYTTGEGSKISIEGRASDKAGIAYFMYNLKNSKFFKDAELKAINNTNNKNAEYTFLVELK